VSAVGSRYVLVLELSRFQILKYIENHKLNLSRCHVLYETYIPKPKLSKIHPS
jgi:hypothetical protein